MSERLCYVSSTDRGDRLATLRLLGARSEDQWKAPESGDPLAVMADVSAAADWIDSRLGSQGRSGELALLCVDVEGASCTWLSAPSTDAAVVSAALARTVEGDSQRLTGAWASPSLADASVEALAHAAPADRGAAAPVGLLTKPGGASRVRPDGARPRRLAVLAIPDVSARLLLDALDDRGISVERVISLWHAMAAAWDPRPASDDLAGPVVAASPQVVATVLIDPKGRLLWSWSRAGQLLAAGTIRLPHDRHESGAGSVRIGSAEIGRLTTDWLSWSVQIGSAPVRIVCLTPETAVAQDDGDFTPAQVGAAIGAAWPGATVDLAVHDDPISATLARLVDHSRGRADDARATLTGLTHRPGRAHRQLHWWAAACLAALALAMAAVGWQARRAATRSRLAETEIRQGMMTLVEQSARPASELQRAKAQTNPRSYLEEQVAAKRQASNPNLDPPKPILSELETLSYVLGNSEVEIDEISLLSSSALVWVRVPNTATGEMLKASLDAVADSHCEWRGEFTDQRGGRGSGQVTYFLQGRWKTTGEMSRGNPTADATGGRR